MLDYLQGINSSSMVLAGVEENEVTNIVKVAEIKSPQVMTILIW